ncbi:MAG: hypothetical protein WA510_26965 [Acidobacteriaceae bacterium]
MNEDPILTAESKQTPTLESNVAGIGLLEINQAHGQSCLSGTGLAD